MHVAVVLTFDAANLFSDGGALNIERLRRYIDHSIQSCERYRQRIEYVPALGHPVWVDDDRFEIDFHVRHASLPAPGSERELKSLVERLLSQKLDRSRPLWEMYFVDGLANNRMALLIKAHHCLVDGVGGMQLLAALLRASPETQVPDGPAAWEPRPRPSGRNMLRQEILHRASGAESLFRSLSFAQLKRGVSGLRNVTKAALSGTSKDSIFTVADRSPQRRFECARFDLADVKAVKASLGGTVNDVVVAVTSGAARRHLVREGVDIDDVEGLQAVLPVHTGGASRDKAGNHVAMLLTDLPVDKKTPAGRLKQVTKNTSELKDESHQSDAAKLIEEIADVSSPKILSGAFKLATHVNAFDMIITNIRGPAFPMYLLGARLESVFPVVPLLPNQTLGIALFSYDGSIYWGFNADWDAFPDLDLFVDDLEAAFVDLKDVAKTGDVPAARQHAQPTA